MVRFLFIWSGQIRTDEKASRPEAKRWNNTGLPSGKAQANTRIQIIYCFSVYLSNNLFKAFIFLSYSALSFVCVCAASCSIFFMAF